MRLEIKFLRNKIGLLLFTLGCLNTLSFVENIIDIDIGKC